jgi:hypothetical protein
MAGITKRERQDKEQITRLEAAVLVANPRTYAYARLEATLRALRKTQDKRIAARRAALDAKQPAAAAPLPRPAWMLKGRGAPEFRDGTVKPAPMASIIPQPGETAAQIRARFEAAAEAE